jgi:hypothetical protein
MSSFVWLGLTVAFVVAVVFVHVIPRGGNPVAGTRLMKSARLVLIGGIIVCGALGLLGSLRH